MTEIRDIPSHSKRRRLITILIIPTILLLLLGLRLIWGEIAHRRLQAELDAAHGQPLTPAEMWPTTDPDPAHNAVPLLIQAMKAAAAVNSAGIDSPSQSNLEYHDYPPYPPAWHKLADAAMAAPGNHKAMALIRRGRSMPEVHWNVAPGGLPPSLNIARNLAALLGDGAIHAHLRGDDLEALRRLRDILFLARAIDQQHTLISHLVGIGIQALVLDRVLTIAPDLRLRRERSDDAVRGEIFAINRDLLDESSAGKSARVALVAERVYQLNTVNNFTQRLWVLRPMYELDLARLLACDRRLMLAATRPSYPEAHNLLLPLDLPPPDLARIYGLPTQTERLSRPLSRPWLGGMNRILLTEMKVRMDSAMASISLAVVMYRADHDGQFPASLAQLVPTYMPLIPRDPFAPDNRRIEYIVLKHALPDGRDRPLLHSVGPDARDDYSAGKQHPPSEPCFSWDVTATPMDDQFRDLARWAPSAATLPIR